MLVGSGEFLSLVPIIVLKYLMQAVVLLEHFEFLRKGLASSLFSCIDSDSTMRSTYWDSAASLVVKRIDRPIFPAIYFFTGPLIHSKGAPIYCTCEVLKRPQEIQVESAQSQTISMTSNTRSRLSKNRSGDHVLVPT